MANNNQDIFKVKIHNEEFCFNLSDINKIKTAITEIKNFKITTLIIKKSIK